MAVQERTESRWSIRIPAHLTAMKKKQRRTKKESLESTGYSFEAGMLKENGVVK